VIVLQSHTLPGSLCQRDSVHSKLYTVCVHACVCACSCTPAGPQASPRVCSTPREAIWWVQPSPPSMSLTHSQMMFTGAQRTVDGSRATAMSPMVCFPSHRLAHTAHFRPISELWPQCKHETDAQTFTGVSCVQSTFLRYLHNRKMKDLNDGNKGQPRPCVLNMHQAVLMSMHHHVS